MKLLYQVWIANDAYDWLLAASLFVLVLLALALARSILRRVLAAFAARTDAGLDSVVAHVIDGTKLWVLFPAAVPAGTSVLDVPPTLAAHIDDMAVIAFIVQAA